jgi:hypothetical protein
MMCLKSLVWVPWELIVTTSVPTAGNKKNIVYKAQRPGRLRAIFRDFGVRPRAIPADPPAPGGARRVSHRISSSRDSYSSSHASDSESAARCGSASPVQRTYRAVPLPAVLVARWYRRQAPLAGRGRKTDKPSRCRTECRAFTEGAALYEQCRQMCRLSTQALSPYEVPYDGEGKAAAK